MRHARWSRSWPASAALLSPSTGIIDSHGYMLALEGNIEAHGGSVVLRCPVERIERDAATGCSAW